jgi:hypothetical protein
VDSPSAKVLHVGYLHPPRAEASIVFKIKVPRLRDLGYIDGTNMALELRSINGRPETLPHWQPSSCDNVPMYWWS